MTTVTVYTARDGSCRGFECHGHAEYVQEGDDIVCAGISAIVINTVNCLGDLLHLPLSVEYDDDGNISCMFDRPENELVREKAALLTDSMIHGLEWIRLQYGDEYLRIVKTGP